MNNIGLERQQGADAAQDTSPVRMQMMITLP